MTRFRNLCRGQAGGLTILWTGRAPGPVLVGEGLLVPRVLETFAFRILLFLLSAAVDTLSEPLTFTFLAAAIKHNDYQYNFS